MSKVLFLQAILFGQAHLLEQALLFEQKQGEVLFTVAGSVGVYCVPVLSAAAQFVWRRPLCRPRPQCSPSAVPGRGRGAVVAVGTAYHPLHLPSVITLTICRE